MPTRRSRIVVRGPNVMQPPLLESENASVIEFYGPNDSGLMALMLKTLSDNTWGLVTQGDADWVAALVRYGYMQPQGSAEDIIRNGL